RAQDPALLLAAELRRRAVHRPQGRVREARGHDQGLPGDHRGQARRAPGAGVLHGRRDRDGGRGGQAARRGVGSAVSERKRFALSVTTPDGPVFEGEAEMVVVPGAAGEIGVLARHAPLVAMLKAGSTRVYTSIDPEEVEELATGPGFFKVES